jgi:methionine-gamma-lyase
MGSAETMAAIRSYRTILGSIPSPHTCWLLTRSLSTLELRMHRQCASAAKVVAFLASCEHVSRLHYPGLKEEEDPTFAAEFEGPGSLIAFELRGGKAQAFRLLNAVEVWVLAVSLGGTESLIEHPASMTHACMTPQQLLHAGVTPGLVRCSVGLEDPDELIADLRDALESSTKMAGEGALEYA